MRDVEIVRAFITAERAMRQSVFRRNPGRLAAKTTEADMALKLFRRSRSECGDADGLFSCPKLSQIRYAAAKD
jgi:hypothetical protein